MKCNYPFGTFPEWVLNAKVSDRAFRLWCHLDRLRRGAESIEVKLQEIADWLGCSSRSIERSIGELKTVSALVVEPNVDGRGQRESTYFLWPWGGDTGDGASYGTGDGAAAPSVTDPGTTPVTDPSSLSERKRPARSQANGAPRKGIHPEGKKILDAFYESRKQSGEPPPVPRSWPEATRIIGEFLELGHAPTRILEALETAPAITANCLSFTLNNPRKSAPADDRPSTWGVDLATEEEVWE